MQSQPELESAPAEKRCTTCKKIKPLEAFQRNRSRVDGRHGQCADCMNARTRQSYAQRPSVIRRQERKQEERKALFHRQKLDAPPRLWPARRPLYLEGEEPDEPESRESDPDALAPPALYFSDKRRIDI